MRNVNGFDFAKNSATRLRIKEKILMIKFQIGSNLIDFHYYAINTNKNLPLKN